MCHLNLKVKSLCLKSLLFGPLSYTLEIWKIVSFIPLKINPWNALLVRLK